MANKGKYLVSNLVIPTKFTSSIPLLSEKAGKPRAIYGALLIFFSAIWQRRRVSGRAAPPPAVLNFKSEERGSVEKKPVYKITDSSTHGKLLLHKRTNDSLKL